MMDEDERALYEKVNAIQVDVGIIKTSQVDIAALIKAFTDTQQSIDVRVRKLEIDQHVCSNKETIQQLMTYMLQTQGAAKVKWPVIDKMGTMMGSVIVGLVLMMAGYFLGKG